jgi:hypothetical protein
VPNPLSSVVAGVWRPTQRQEDLLLCPYDEILFGGAAGGGKSEGLIGDWLYWHARWGKTGHGLILRKTYRELSDLVLKSRKILGAAYGQNAFSKSEFLWTLPDGCRLQLGYLDTYEDWFNYQGHEYTYMGWDEATLWENDKAYLQMFSRLRGTLPDRSPHPTRTVLTTNPGGPGHHWVKKRFVDIGPPETPKKFKVVVNLDGEERTYEKTRIFLPSRVTDNPYLANSGYIANLAMLNPTQKAMMLYGEWNVQEGQFFHEWNTAIHVVDYFLPPKEWPRFMGMDWGTSDPFCVLWGAKAPNGDKYIYRELYGNGDHEAASSVRDKILSIEQEYGEYVVERYLDSSCFSKIGFANTIADQFQPIHFEPAQRANKPGMLNLIREHLKVVNGQSRLKITSNCINLIRCLPALTVDELHPDKYKDTQEDHPVDALGYSLRGSLPIEIEQGLARYNARYYDALRGGSSYGAH